MYIVGRQFEQIGGCVEWVRFDLGLQHAAQSKLVV